MKIVRGNAVTEIQGAPLMFMEALQRYLAVPIDNDEKLGLRYSRKIFDQGQMYASLVHGNHVAAGLTPHVESLAKLHGLPAEVRDVRERPGMARWGFIHAPWRPYQDEVHRQVTHYGTGVVDAPPRSGKTLMAARAIDEIGRPALYLAPSVPIVRQTYEVFCKIFGMEMVARLDGEALPEQRDISKPIVVATAASAVKQSREWFATRGTLVIDEFHHSAAETYHRINLLSDRIFYRLCWTGTHFRTGDDELAMHAICSLVLHRITVGDLVNGGFLAPPRVCFVPVPVRAREYSRLSWDQAYQKGIVECEERNARIAQLARTLAFDNGVPTIVLTRRRKHAHLLGDMIPDSTVVKGGEGELTSRAVRDFSAGHVRVLVGTTVIGEGVDLPTAGALVYASAGNEGVSMLQSYFRPLTAHPSKSVGRIYDFRDLHHRTLSEHAEARRGIAHRVLGNVVVL